MAQTLKKNLQSTTIVAKLFDLDERRIQQLAKEGVLPAVSRRPYQFDLLPTVKAYIKYLRERASGKEEKDVDVVKAEADKLRAEADLKQSKAKIAEIQLKELEGKMHRSEDVEAVTTDLVYTVRGMIMALPGRLAMDIAKCSGANEASALIRSECCGILNELANYEYDPEIYKKRVREREGWGDPVDEGDDD